MQKPAEINARNLTYLFVYFEGKAISKEYLNRYLKQLLQTQYLSITSPSYDFRL